MEEAIWGLTKDDLLRMGEILVLSVIAVLVILLVLRPVTRKVLGHIEARNPPQPSRWDRWLLVTFLVVICSMPLSGFIFDWVTAFFGLPASEVDVPYPLEIFGSFLGVLITAPLLYFLLIRPAMAKGLVVSLTRRHLVTTIVVVLAIFASHFAVSLHVHQSALPAAEVPPWEQHFNAGQRALEQEAYSEAEQHFNASLEAAETSGPLTLEVSASLTGLASLYQETGRNGEAMGSLQRSLEAAEAAAGPESREVGVVLGILAGHYSVQGRIAEAVPLLERAIAINEKVFGPESVEVAGGLVLLGLVYWRQGYNIDAEELLKRSVSIYGDRLGMYHRDLVLPLRTLARIDQSRGNYFRAEHRFLRAISILERSFGGSHSKVAAVLHDLGELYMDRQEYPKAEPAFKRVLAIHEKSSGLSGRRSSGSVEEVANRAFKNLILVLRRTDRQEEADALLAQSQRPANSEE